MENVLLLSAACLTVCAAAASFLLKGKKELFLKLLWGLAAGLVLLDLSLMVCYLSGGRFDFAYVYNHTDSGLPFAYKISALWSGQEGSFLLWTVTLFLMGIPLLPIKNKRNSKAFGVYALITSCICLLCFISQPFARTGGVPANGLGMADALRDPWMVVHPPLVFIAYSAMAVLAALSAELSWEPKFLVLKRLNFWVRFSWIMLGLGIFTGSVWAYRALGWGGYWSWDPIENAALVPWLILCGHLHKKGNARRSKYAVPFAAACFGTFLTRSGILGGQSAHAYADGSTLISILLIVLLLLAAVWIFFSKNVRKEKRRRRLVDLCKDKKLLFVNLLYVFAGLVFLGTIVPLILSAEAPQAYYDGISIAFALSYAALMLAWDWQAAKRYAVGTMALATLAVLCAVLLLRPSNIFFVLLLWFCLLPLSLWAVSGFKTQNWKFCVLHTGITLLIIGAICSSGLSKNAYALAQPGSAELNINGISIPLSDVQTKNVLIVSEPSGDIILQSTGAVTMSDGSLAIPYATRPLVFLFWAGGFTMILGTWIAAIAQKILTKKPVMLAPMPFATMDGSRNSPGRLTVNWSEAQCSRRGGLSPWVRGWRSMMRLTLRTIFFARAKSAASTMMRRLGSSIKTQAQNRPTMVDFPLERNAISNISRSCPRQRAASQRAMRR